MPEELDTLLEQSLIIYIQYTHTGKIIFAEIIDASLCMRDD